MNKLAMKVMAGMGLVLANIFLCGIHVSIELHEARVVLRYRVSLWDASWAVLLLFDSCVADKADWLGHLCDLSGMDLSEVVSMAKLSEFSVLLHVE